MKDVADKLFKLYMFTHNMESFNVFAMDPKKKTTQSCYRIKYMEHMVLVVVTAIMLLLLLIMVALMEGWMNTSDVPVIRVKQGLLKGRYHTTRKGHRVFSFLGIPYAKPPVGLLRFKNPQPPEPWNDIWDATEDGPSCTQLGDDNIFTGQEDCLYLNVYTPSIPSNGNSSYAVMVWIHGGGWFGGSSSSQSFGPEYLLDHKVVLVAMNYRLGPLGFLSTGDDVIPGNFGLKDQVAALKWVKDNIADFGGNPNSITIFGGSAGGASVHFHMLSPMSRGLFHRAISQSGTALAPFSYINGDVAKAKATKLAKHLDCSTTTSEDLLNCLMLKGANSITEAQALHEYKIWDGLASLAFPPVIEGHQFESFLPQDPLLLLKTAEFVPWMTGINAQEGCMLAATLFSKPERLKKFDEEFDDIVLDTMYLSARSKPELKHTPTGFVKRIRQFYFGENKIEENSLNDVINMYTDSYFTFPMNWSVQLHTTFGRAPVYVYLFTYVGSMSHKGIFGDSTRNYGSCHGDELFYLFPFGRGFSNFVVTSEDEKMIDTMTMLWTNFAQYGNPTPEINSLITVLWDRVTQFAGNYLNIGFQMHRRTTLLPEAVKLWNDIFMWTYQQDCSVETESCYVNLTS